MVNDAQIKMKVAREFAARNVVQGAIEILEWKNTSILRDGVLRECERMLEDMGITNGLTVAESLFIDEALKVIANGR